MYNIGAGTRQVWLARLVGIGCAAMGVYFWLLR